MTSVNYAKLKKERNPDVGSAVGSANLHYLTEVTEFQKNKYIASGSVW